MAYTSHASDEVIEIILKTRVDQDTLRKQISIAANEASKIQETISRHEERIMRFMSQHAQTLSKNHKAEATSRSQAISQEEKKLQLMQQQLEILQAQGSTYKMLASNPLGGLFGNTSVRNTEREKQVKELLDIEAKSAKQTIAIEKNVQDNRIYLEKEATARQKVELEIRQQQQLAYLRNLKNAEMLFQREIALERSRTINKASGFSNMSTAASNIQAAISTPVNTNTYGIQASSANNTATSRVTTAAFGGTPKVSAEQINTVAQATERATRKQQDWNDAWEKGSTLGHKFATTMQYMFAGTIIFGTVQAVTAGIQAITEFDTATRTMAAVLDMTLPKAQALGQGLNELGKAYGGQLNDIYGVTLALGRAGLATKDLIAGTEVVMRMARLTGDTFEQSASAVISYQQVFGSTGATIEQLGDKLAYIANVSRLSTQDIGTFSNYALSAAKSVGMTVDAVGAMAAAFSNAGVNASTIGTQIRRFTTLLTEDSSEIKQLFIDLGVSQEALFVRMQQGPKESNAALEEFARKLAKISDQDFADYTAGMDLLAKDSLNKLRQNQENFSRFLHGSLEESKGALQSTDVILQGYAVTWERLWNTAKDVAIDSLSGISDKAISITDDLLHTADILATLLSGDKSAISDASNKTAIYGQMRIIQELQKQYNAALEEGNAKEAVRLSLKIQDADLEKRRIEDKSKGVILAQDEATKTKLITDATKVLVEYSESKNKHTAAETRNYKETIKLVEKLSGELSAQEESSQSSVKSTALTRDFLVQQVSAAIRNGTATKELLSYTNNILDTEINTLRVKAANLIITEKLNDKTREMALSGIDFTKSSLYNLIAIQKTQEALQRNKDPKLKGSVDSQVASLNSVADIIRKIGELEEQKDTISAKHNKAQASASKQAESAASKAERLAREFDATKKKELATQIALTEETEATYLYNNKIADSVATAQYHLNETLPQQINLTAEAWAQAKTAATQEELEAKILEYSREYLDTSRKTTLELEKRRVAAERSIEDSKNALLIVGAKSEAYKIEYNYMQKINAIEREKEERESKGEILSAKEIASYKSRIDLVKAETKELREQLKLTQARNAEDIRLGTGRYLEDLKLKTEYEEYSIALGRDARDSEKEAKRLFEDKKISLEEYLAKLDLVSEKDKRNNYQTFVAMTLQQSMQSELNSSLMDFFDIQSEGWMDFERLGMNVLNNILQQMLQMQVVQPLAAAGSSAIGSLGTMAMNWLASADGNVFSNGHVKAYAKGGSFTNSIVRKPTYFASGGTMGVMGESGAESVMPLKRNSQGQLGVIAQGGSGVQSVNVTIHNETTGEQLQVTRSESKVDYGEIFLDVWIDAVTRNRKGTRDVVRSIR